MLLYHCFISFNFKASWQYSVLLIRNVILLRDSLYFHEKFDAVWKAFRDFADIETSLTVTSISKYWGDQWRVARPKHDRYDADDERRGDVDGIGGWERTNKDICQSWITELWWKRNERDEKVEDFERGTKPENDLMALGKRL